MSRFRRCVAVTVVAATACLATGPTAIAAGPDNAPAKQADVAPMNRQALPENRQVAGQWQIEGLDAALVNDFAKYVKQDQAGRYSVNAPWWVEAFDGDRNAIAEHAVSYANEVRAGQDQAAAAQPTGPKHAETKVEWWGLTITLDAVGVDQLVAALQAGATTGDIVKLLGGLGAVVGPQAGPIMVVVGTVLATVSRGGVDGLAKCRTDKGAVVKTLWIGVTWCEKPA